MSQGPLVIQFAMRMEAAPLLAAGHFQPISLSVPDHRYGFLIHQGQTRLGNEVIVAIAGIHPRDQVDSIGTLSAGLLTHVLISQFQPRMIINAGTAGGFHARGGQVGDVYLGESPVVFHDRRVQLPGNFPRFSEGHRPVRHDLELRQALGLKAGVVSSGDSLDCTDEDMKHLLRLGASVKEMEAAAIATICEARAVPLVLLKSITDIVDDHPQSEGLSTEEQFLKNYSFAVSSLIAKLESVIEWYSR